MLDFCHFYLRHSTNISLSDKNDRRDRQSLKTSMKGSSSDEYKLLDEVIFALYEKEGGAKVKLREGLMAVDFCLKNVTTFDDLSFSA